VHLPIDGGHRLDTEPLRLGDIDAGTIEQQVPPVDQQIGKVVLPGYFINPSGLSGQSAQLVGASAAAGLEFAKYIAGKKDGKIDRFGTTGRRPEDERAPEKEDRDKRDDGERIVCFHGSLLFKMVRHFSRRSLTSAS
jgi:hypothetical protein